MSAPKKHHYIPVTYLANFSLETTKPPRTRGLYVVRRSTGRPIKQATENIGYIKNFYKITEKIQEDSDELFIEKNWQGIEGSLNKAIDQLINSNETPLNSTTWARVLVPFVTSLFIRGPSFDKSFLTRSPFGGSNAELADLVTPDNTNYARLIELQRMLAPVMASRWVVMHTSSPEPVITNDLGYGFYTSHDHDDTGFVVPLSQTAALGIIPRTARILAEGTWPGDWFTPIEHHTLPPGTQAGLNRAIAAISQEFIAGPTAASVSSVARNMQELQEPPRLFAHALRSTTVRSYETDWGRFLYALSHQPGDARINAFDYDPNIIAAEPWSPAAVYLPINIEDVRRKVGLQYKNRKITIEFDQNFTFEEYLDSLWKADRYAIGIQPERIAIGFANESVPQHR